MWQRPFASADPSRRSSRWLVLHYLTLAILLGVAVMVQPAIATAAPAPPQRQVLRQELSVTLLPESHLLKGVTTLTFPSAGKVELSLVPSATVEQVTVGGKSVPFSFREGTLSITLAGDHEAPVSVAVTFRAAFNDQVAEHPASSEEPSYGVSGAITSRGTFLGAGSHWYPTPSTIPAARSVTIEAPAGTEGITSGRRVSRETRGGISRSVWSEEHPVGELSLSAGPYLVAEARSGDILLYSYLYPDNASLSARYLEAADRYIRFYSGLFGPYPFEKFAVVENFFPTGYGLPSYTLLGSTVIRLPFIIHTSFPHEVAHSWWGTAVEIDPSQGNWAEGLVTYLADYLLKEQSSPREGREYRLQVLSDFASLVTPARDFPLRLFMGRVDPASRAIGYGKGAMLFHMVRRKIGDEAFFMALRDVCRERLYGEASWDDFIGAFSRRGGEDLSPFVSQWLNGRGGARLALAEVTRTRTGKGWSVSGIVRQSPPLYRLQVPLRVETEKGGESKKVEITGAATPFSITVPDPPTGAVLDPEADVFRLLSQEEIPATVNRLKGSHSVIAVVTKGCRARPETLKILLQSLDQGDAPVIAEEKVEQGMLRGNDLLVCGKPVGALLPSLPREISLSERGFVAQGKEFTGEDDLLLVVGENRMAPGKVAALFLPLSEKGAERYVPKITHYGKYGYLVFSGGQNRGKGTFMPETGPGVVRFE